MSPDKAGAAAAALEETGWVPVGGGGAYCLVCRPATPSGAGCVLLAPLADERKSSLRAMVTAARALASAGIAAARVDYRGTGDASGASEALSLESMVADAAAAARALRDEYGCGRVALAGLRLGGAVALLAAERAGADAVAMMEPVVSGATYVRELRRRQSIRRMLTKGKGDAPGDAPEDGPFDLDGTALARSFIAELEGLDLVKSARGISAGKAPPSLVMQVGPRRAASKDTTALAEALGDGARAVVLRAEPFWLQTDHVDPAPAVEELLGFLGETLLGKALLGHAPPPEVRADESDEGNET